VRNPSLEQRDFILGDGSDSYAPSRAEVLKITDQVRDLMPSEAAEAVLGAAYNESAHIALKDGAVYIVHSLDKAGGAVPVMWPHSLAKSARSLYLTNDDRGHTDMFNGAVKSRSFKAGYTCDVCGGEGKHGEFRWMCRAPSCVVCVDCFAGCLYGQAVRDIKLSRML
jgi:hypothetical protein